MSLSEIVTSTETNRAPKILLYGVHGIGKSTFGAQLPKPIFLRTEDGMKGHQFEGIPRLPIARSWEQVKAQMAMLIGDEHNYRSLVVDSIDWLERLIFEKVATNKDVEDINDIGYSAGYKMATTHMMTFLSLCDELYRERKMLICFLGHAGITKYDPPDGEAYDKYGLALHKWVVPLVYEWVDNAIFVNFKTRVKSSGDSFGQAKFKGLGGNERSMYTEFRATHHAKNRYSLPYEMDFDEKTAWSSLEKLIFNNKTGE